jgi:hypothetical protein
MPTTTDGGENSGLRACSDGALHIAYIRAACDDARRAGHHTIPNDTRVFVAAFSRAQQITFESLVERRVNIFAGVDHFVISSQNVLVYLTSLLPNQPLVCKTLRSLPLFSAISAI